MLKINKNYVSPEPEEQDTLNNNEWSDALDEFIKYYDIENEMLINNNGIGIDIKILLLLKRIISRIMLFIKN